MHHRQKKYLLIVLLLVSAIIQEVAAQRVFNTPLSRFNIGTLESTESIKSKGLGGIGTGLRANDQIFEVNPASYSAFDTTSFILDFGMDFRMLNISDGSSKQTSNDLGFHHIKIGFPITKQWGVALGIAPYSNSYYNLEYANNEESTYSHIGKGGLNKIFFGTGAQIIQNLNFGANLNVYYGEIFRENKCEFVDKRVNSINSNETFEAHGIDIDLGIQYQYNLKNNQYIVVGVKTNLGCNISTTFSTSMSTYNNYNTEVIREITDKTKLALPTSFDFGASYVIPKKLTVGADFLYSQWGNTTIPGSADYTTNTYSCRAGVEYIPNASDYFNIFNIIEYRLGTHFGNDYLKYSEKNINTYGVSLGIGIPMRKTNSRINFYLDYSVRSLNAASNEIKERMITTGASLNLIEIWFLKSRYE